MKIAIFGASVSAQTVRRDTGLPVGYAEFLRREHMQDLGATAINQLPYSGSRLADGGMIRLMDILDYKPDICIVEPIVEDKSRGLEAVRADYVFVYSSMIEAGILPVTLLQPWPLENRTLNAYKIVSKLCKDWGLPTIEFDLPEGISTADYFEGVHTKELGGRLYARAIAEGIRLIGSPAVALIKAKAHYNASENRFVATKCPVGERKSFRRLVIDVTSEAVGAVNFRLLQFQDIGTFSPVFKASLQSTKGKLLGRPNIISVWDPYCHYTRQSFVLLAADTSPVPRFRIGVEVIDQAPNYATVRHAVESWPALSELQFRPRRAPYLISDAPVELHLVDYA